MDRTLFFRLTVFLSAFLLFQIQPMTSRALLPVFGGSYLVWGSCMVFYQAMLLLGYAYAHGIQRRLGVRRYARIHCALMVLPLAWVLTRLTVSHAAPPDLPLGMGVAVMLLVAVGPPVFVLTTTSLLLQRWLEQSNLPDRANPYVLYSASNVGSILGLVLYPVLVEPWLGLDAQWIVWVAGFGVLALLQLLCLPDRPDETATPATPEPEDAAGLAPAKAGLWFMLSFATSFLLIAVTNVLTLDIASVPFLWILPLCAYLLSFVLVFKRRFWFPPWARPVFYWMVIVAVLLHLMMQLRLRMDIWLSIPLHLILLFWACLTCHGELMLRKPLQSRHLTTYYLVIAAGGLAGSLLVSWVIPVVSGSLVEYLLGFLLAAIALALCGPGEGMPVAAGDAPIRFRLLKGVAAGLLVIVAFIVIPIASEALRNPIRAHLGPGPDAGKILQRVVLIAIAVPAMLALRWVTASRWTFAAVLATVAVAITWTENLVARDSRVRKTRNYYGIYTLFDKDNIRYLKHGTTLHGREFIQGDMHGVPVSYYHPTTPIGELLTDTNHPFRHIGMIGLGAGAMAAYMRSGQTLTILELDPDNLPIAEREFSYLSRGRERGGVIRIQTGDGRILLRSFAPGSLDLLVVDAFNSDSIPVHLLTCDAIKEYFRVLGPRGLLLLHVSNRLLELHSVVYANAGRLGLSACQNSNEGHKDPNAEQTHWMALSRDPAEVDRLVTGPLGWWRRTGDSPLPKPWTDQYADVLGALLRQRE